MNEQELQEFVQWLPTSGIAEFDQKTPDEVVTILNGLSSEKDGETMIKTLIEQYKKSKEGSPETGMFKRGGKLVYLTELYKKGGKTKKCKCGCDLKRVMEKGGVVEKCACGCKTAMKAKGGTIKEPLVKKPLPKIPKKGQKVTKAQSGTKLGTPKTSKVNQYIEYPGRTVMSDSQLDDKRIKNSMDRDYKNVLTEVDNISMVAPKLSFAQRFEQAYKNGEKSFMWNDGKKEYEVAVKLAEASSKQNSGKQFPTKQVPTQTSPAPASAKSAPAKSAPTSIVTKRTSVPTSTNSKPLSPIPTSNSTINKSTSTKSTPSQISPTTTTPNKWGSDHPWWDVLGRAQEWEKLNNPNKTVSVPDNSIPIPTTPTTPNKWGSDHPWWDIPGRAQEWEKLNKTK